MPDLTKSFVSMQAPPSSHPVVTCASVDSSGPSDSCSARIHTRLIRIERAAKTLMSSSPPRWSVDRIESRWMRGCRPWQARRSRRSIRSECPSLIAVGWERSTSETVRRTRRPKWVRVAEKGAVSATASQTSARLRVRSSWHTVRGRECCEAVPRGQRTRRESVR